MLWHDTSEGEMPVAINGPVKRGFVGKSASIIPNIVAAASLAVCLALIFPVLSSKSGTLAGIGYFLGPVAIGVCAAMDRFLQQNGSIDPTFIEKPNYTKILQLLLILSFVFALFHIWVAADVLGEIIGERLRG